MFAARTHWALDPNPLTVALARLRQSGIPVLDLTVSNPTRCGFSYPSRQILNALTSPRNLSYDPSPQGLPAAREALARFYARKGVCVSPDRIFLTASTSEAYAFIFRLLADPGASVLFPRPSYPLFQFLADMNDLKMTSYPLRYQGEWRLDLNAFSEAVDNGTRAIVCVNPNNPTGTYLNAEELGRMNAVCRQRDAALISDEVFFQYSFEPDVGLSLAGNTQALTFVLGGLSKDMGLPQIKLSWIIMNGPDAFVDEARKRLEIISDTFLSVNTPAQNALEELLALQPAIQGQILDRVRDNRALLQKEIIALPETRLLNAQGGWYGVVRLPGDSDEESWALTLLEQDRVFVHPGYFFDFDDEPYIVISLLPAPDVFAEGVGRLVRRIQAG